MSNQSSDNQEIDLGSVFSNINQGIKRFLFNCIKFVLKNKFVLGILFILGVATGYYQDSKPTYINEIILRPNFNTADYLYSKIDQFNSYKSINENNILEKKYQLKKRKKIGSFKIEPINDIYRFLKDNESGYNFLKLMAEDGSIKKIIDEDVTSKNYEFHKVTFKSSEILTKEDVVIPFMSFINDDDYLRKLHVINYKNAEKKLETNDSIIKQIDQIFKKFGSQSASSSLSISSENVPLDNLFYIKDKLINEINYFDVVKLQASDIVKDHAVILNIKDTKGLNGKMKLIYPFLFIILYVIVVLIKDFYQKNKTKLSA